MLQRDSRKPVGKNRVKGRRFYELPMHKTHHLKHGTLADITQGQINSLADEPLVFVMTDDQHPLSHTVTVKLPDRVPDHGRERRTINACCSAEVLAAAVLGLGSLAV